jgi:hypothetical protein
MSTEMNPDAPPTAFVDDVRRASELEATRREHLKHEASVRSVGTMYYAGSVLWSLFGVYFLLVAVRGTDFTAWPLAVVCLVFGLASLAVAWGLRGLQRWAASAAAVLSALSLPVIPFGTVIGAYVLVLLRSAKGRRIFARDYAGIVAATPHIEPGSSRVVWIVFAVAAVLGAATLVYLFVLR